MVVKVRSCSLQRLQGRTHCLPLPASGGSRHSSACGHIVPVSVLLQLLSLFCPNTLGFSLIRTTTTVTKSLQSCPTLCDPIDGSPPGSPVPGILQARTPEWVAISFSSFPLKLEEVTVQYTQAKSYLTLCDPHGLQPTRLLSPWNSLGKNTGVGCHCLLVTKVQ